MFDLGADKLLIISMAVLIFVGPKELPAAARTIGGLIRQVQSWRDMLHAEALGLLQTSSEPTQPSVRSPFQDQGGHASRVEDDDLRFPPGPQSFR